MRVLLTTLLQRLLQRSTALWLALSFALGFAAAFAFSQWIPVRPEAPPLVGIVATTLLLLVTQAAALAFLGSESAAAPRWTSTVAFVKTGLLSAAGHVGIAATGAVPSIGMLATAWATSVAFAAILCVLYSLTNILLSRKRLALQCVLLIAILLNSALFWSRSIITDSGMQGLADGVMKLSPPLALSAAWHQEGQSHKGGREDSRFDIIRSPLTYDIWVGSYQAVPYPQIFPQSSSTEPFQPGLLLTLFLWSLPLLIFAESLSKKPVPQKSEQ